MFLKSSILYQKYLCRVDTIRTCNNVLIPNEGACQLAYYPIKIIPTIFQVWLYIERCTLLIQDGPLR